jgi:hypothetical protein
MSPMNVVDLIEVIAGEHYPPVELLHFLTPGEYLEAIDYRNDLELSWSTA